MKVETLQVCKLSAGYKGKRIVRDVSFEVKAGEVCALLGPNGSGKTTILRCIAGVMRPISGSVLINGKNMRDHMVKLIGYLPQSIEGKLKITVIEYILLGMAINKGFWKVRKEDVEVAHEALVTLGIENLALKNLDELSGGQRRLCDIALVLAKKPEILILDEPTSSLDIKNSFDVLETIRSVTKAEKLITLIALHDLNHAMEFSDHCAVLNSGKLITFGNPVEVLSPQLVEKVYGIYVEKISINGNKRLVTLGSASCGRIKGIIDYEEKKDEKDDIAIYI